MEESTKVVFETVLNLEDLEADSRSTIVLNCCCCPSVWGSEAMLDKIQIWPEDVISVPITGITDTFLSRGGKHATHSLHMNLKHIFQNNEIKRLVVLVRDRCQKDTFGSNRGKAGEQVRLDEIIRAGSILNGWLPACMANVDLEFYLIKQVGKKFKLGKVYKKTFRAKPHARPKKTAAVATA